MQCAQDLEAHLGQNDAALFAPGAGNVAGRGQRCGRCTGGGVCAGPRFVHQWRVSNFAGHLRYATLPNKNPQKSTKIPALGLNYFWAGISKYLKKIAAINSWYLHGSTDYLSKSLSLPDLCPSHEFGSAQFITCDTAFVSLFLWRRSACPQKLC